MGSGVAGGRIGASLLRRGAAVGGRVGLSSVLVEVSSCLLVVRLVLLLLLPERVVGIVVVVAGDLNAANWP